jgi:hypothetical protein
MSNMRFSIETEKCLVSRLVSAAFFVLVLFVAFLGGCATQAVEEQVESPSQSPNINGLWQAMGNAHWNVEGQSAFKGPATHLLGALGGVPASLNYVQGGEIPYLPEARIQRDKNRAEWNLLDPVVKCYIPGIPRQTYMPLPFHIVQSPTKIFIAYEFGSNSRIIHLDRDPEPADLPSWMGYSTGRWEGNTLVVTVTDQVADTWFDAAGNFHSDALTVTERYTPINENLIEYSATIEDPSVFLRPWTIVMPLYRRVEADAQLLEYKCVPFAEDAVYGHLNQGEDRHKPIMKNLH